MQQTKRKKKKKESNEEGSAHEISIEYFVYRKIISRTGKHLDIR
jgi:hypothetical protein